MLAGMFDGFVIVVAVLVVATIARFVATRPAGIAAVGLAIWFSYVSAVVALGVVQNVSTRPPGPVFLLGPVVIFLGVLLLRPSITARFVTSIPLRLLIGAQAFRIGVELFLHQLWLGGIVPKMLTFEGMNFDIYVGLSAPLIAWLATRGMWGLRAALVWNVVGLMVLANVVMRAIVTAPGPLNVIHTEVPNMLLGTFPYLLVPGFFVPLAVTLHLFAVRRIRLMQKAKQPAVR